MWQQNATTQNAWIWKVDLGNFRAMASDSLHFGAGGSFLDTTNGDIF